MFIEPSLRLRVKKEERTPFDREEDSKVKKESFTYKPIKLDELIMPADHKQGYAIVADSGMGKTMLLEELALRISEKKIETKLIPVLLSFSQLTNVNSSDDIKKLIKDKLMADEYLIDKWFKNKHFLFLIDGLDQIRPPAHFLTNILSSNVFWGNHLLFTTRPFAYSMFDSNLSLSRNYHYVEIDLFNQNQVKEYLEEDYEKIKKILSFSPDLLRIPILLSHIKALNKDNNLKNIQTRNDLYGKIVEKLFTHEKERWTLQGKNYSKDDLLLYFMKLSFYTLSKGNIYRFPRSLSNEGLEYIGVNRENFDFLLKFGIIHEIVEGDKEEIVFRHQSFQEYFAACKLKSELFKDNRLNQDILEESLEYRHWDEVIIFVVGMLGKEDAKTLIEEIKGYDLYLAGLCLGEYKGDRKVFSELIDRLLKMACKGYKRASETLIRIADVRIVDKLIESLKDNDSEVRRNAASVLGKIGSERAIEPLIERLKDDGPDVRWKADSALGEIGSERAIKPLIKRLKDDNPDVRRSAAYALGEIGSERAIKPLIERLKDDNPYVRWSAASALGEIGSERAIKPLIERLKDDNPYVRWSAASALGEIAKDLNKEGQDMLVKRIYSSKLDSEIKEHAITKIKQATARRFIKLTRH